MNMASSVSSRIVENHLINSSKQVLSRPTKMMIGVVAIAVLLALGYYLLRTCSCFRRSNHNVRVSVADVTLSRRPSIDGKSKDVSVPKIYFEPNSSDLTFIDRLDSPLSSFPTNLNLISEPSVEQSSSDLKGSSSVLPEISIGAADSIDLTAQQTSMLLFSSNASDSIPGHIKTFPEDSSAGYPNALSAAEGLSNDQKKDQVEGPKNSTGPRIVKRTRPISYGREKSARNISINRHNASRSLPVSGLPLVDESLYDSSTSFPPIGGSSTLLPLTTTSAVSLPTRGLTRQSFRTSLTVGRESLPSQAGTSGPPMGFGIFNPANIRAGLRKTGESPKKAH